MAASTPTSSPIQHTRGVLADSPPPDEAHLRAFACWLDVDLDAIRHNVQLLRQWVGPSSSVAAVVKAEAYSMGAPQIAETLLDAGAARLAVARVHEGVELRESGLSAPILVLSRTDPSEAAAVAAHDLAVTVDTAELAQALDREARQLERRVTVHMKVDTGLHRFGISPDGAIPLARELADLPNLRIEGLWTHLASADDEDLASAQQQLRLFARVSDDLEEAGYHFPMRHAANSAATLALPGAHFDMVRVGQSLYGINPFTFAQAGIELRPAVSLRARVARVMNLAPGDAVGYNETWRATKPTRAATLTAGYADGVPRALSNRGCVSILGQTAPILGRVMMDHVVVDISGINGVQPGTEATIFGRDDGHAIDIWDVARAADSIPHDVLIGVGGRVPRVYRERNRIRNVARLTGSLEVRPSA